MRPVLLLFWKCGQDGLKLAKYTYTRGRNLREKGRGRTKTLSELMSHTLGKKYFMHPEELKFRSDQIRSELVLWHCPSICRYPEIDSAKSHLFVSQHSNSICYRPTQFHRICDWTLIHRQEGTLTSADLLSTKAWCLYMHIYLVDVTKGWYQLQLHSRSSALFVWYMMQTPS